MPSEDDWAIARVGSGPELGFTGRRPHSGRGRRVAVAPVLTFSYRYPYEE